MIKKIATVVTNKKNRSVAKGWEDLWAVSSSSHYKDYMLNLQKEGLMTMRED